MFEATQPAGRAATASGGILAANMRSSQHPGDLVGEDTIKGVTQAGYTRDSKFAEPRKVFWRTATWAQNRMPCAAPGFSAA